MKEYSPLFKKITTLLCLVSDIPFYEIKGVRDTETKIWACYLAKKLTDAGDKTIAEYFNINPNFMNNQLENLAINFLMDPAGEALLKSLELAYRRLEEIPADE